MAKAGGTAGRGRRLRHEVPDIPSPDGLDDLGRRCQAAVARLVEEVGGRFDSKTAVPARHLELFASLFEAWAVRHGERQGDGVYFGGQPGLWHALDDLYPLQDPNRWDGLRREVIRQLERDGWRRRTPPRGAAFDIPLGR